MIAIVCANAGDSRAILLTMEMNTRWGCPLDGCRKVKEEPTFTFDFDLEHYDIENMFFLTQKISISVHNELLSIFALLSFFISMGILTPPAVVASKR